jgi:hypothetical protein
MPSETGVEPTGETSWILVEAKGNLKELRTSCGAGPKSLERIRRALAETADAMGIAVAGDWLTGYYSRRTGWRCFISSLCIESQPTS